MLIKFGNYTIIMPIRIIEKQNSITFKKIVSGILVALILTSGTLIVFNLSGKYRHEDTGSNILIDPINWDFSSSLALSENIEENSENLLIWSVSVRKIIASTTDNSENVDITGGDGSVGAWVGGRLPYFSHNISGIHAWTILDRASWIFRYELALPQFYEPWYSIDPEIFPPLHAALSNDMSSISDWKSISEDQSNTMMLNASRVGTIYFLIQHYYQDGSIISIETYNNTSFIRYEKFLSFESSYNYWETQPDNKFPEMWYTGVTDGQFPFYSQAVNELLAQFFSN